MVKTLIASFFTCICFYPYALMCLHSCISILHRTNVPGRAIAVHIKVDCTHMQNSKMRSLSISYSYFTYTSISSNGVFSLPVLSSQHILTSMSFADGRFSTEWNHGPKWGAQHVELLGHWALPSQSIWSMKSIKWFWFCGLDVSQK